jgi:hypothetical protein
MLNKGYMKTIQLLLILALSFALTNCQKEEEEIITDTPPTESIRSGSPLAGLIIRNSQSPTACDNVLDNTSCFRVVLPVTVTVNGNQVAVTTEDDYQTVQDLIDNTSGNDIVYFTYPITIQYQNFTTQVINDWNELENAIDDCDDDDGLDEIDCVFINYPIVVNVYNTSTQTTNTVTIQSNIQLYNFINGLSSGVIAAIVYPISAVNSDGSNIVINNNSELESFLEDSIDDCDDDGGTWNPTFTSVLTTGTWYVSYYFEDDDNETDDYNGFNFTFFGNSNIEVVNNSVTTSGTWSTYTDGGQDKVEFTFVNPDLSSLQEDWLILEYNQTTIRLKHVSGGDGSIDYLNFTKL